MSFPLVRRTGLFAALLALGWAALAAPPEPPKGTVTGVLTLDGKKIALKHAAAYTYDSTMAPGKKGASLLLSDRPVTEKGFKENFIWGPGEPVVPGLIEGAWKSLHASGALQGVAFMLGPDGKMISAVILVGGQEEMFDLMGSDLAAEVKSVAPRLVGTVRTATDPHDAGAYKVALQASFDVPATNLK